MSRDSKSALVQIAMLGAAIVSQDVVYEMAVPVA